MIKGVYREEARRIQGGGKAYARGVVPLPRTQS